MAKALRFGVMGPLRVCTGETELELGTRLQRSMLALLLLARGRAVSTEQLIDGLWDDPPAQATRSVRTYASGLRKVLGVERVVFRGGGYALPLTGASFDLADFDATTATTNPVRLRQALELWRGTPLAGLPGPAVAAQRTLLVERHLGVQERLAEAELARGGHAQVVEELTALAAQHPLRERLHGLLMRALYRSGRQADALAVYQRVRTALAAELGIDPGHDLNRVYQDILARTPALACESAGSAEHGSTGAVPSTGLADGAWLARPAPAQLPADIADFTGRGDLVAQLTATLTDPPARAMTICAITGIGGIGKTTLAIRVAHAIRGHYPDGQMYADLRGLDEPGTDPARILGEFLEALGVPNRAIPAGVETRAALYRSLLADRRILILLDNARDAAQIASLLPGTPACAVLITSRSQLPGLTGARRITLDVLQQDEGLALFAGVLGETRVRDEPAPAQELVAACGFLPLAVRIAAARLATRPTWTIAHLAERLADERRTLAELRTDQLTVETGFQLSYRQLDNDQARAFKLLALPDTPDLELHAAAAILELHPARAEPIIESLVDLSLLQSPAAGRYRYHHLLRLFARARARDEDIGEHPVEPVLARLLDFYLATSRNSYRRIHPSSPAPNRPGPTRHPGLDLPDKTAARAWWTAELPGITKAVQQAGQHSPEVRRTAAELLDTVNSSTKDWGP
ncbi:AfsR/SARP family transcriptional regulator [Streptomyces sp. NPDC053474]|uniref:AfsR/SARP family transcriptional regulator n=1 Tax=Streptomyces sp. NPDC053474 TaxID=3365704 RepID=UPI0037D79114